MIELAEEAEQVARQIDNPWGLAFSAEIKGFAFIELAEFSRAIDSLEAAIRDGVEANFMDPMVTGRYLLGLVYGGLGDIERGLEMAQLALGTAKNLNPTEQGGPLATMAKLYLGQGEIEKAQAKIDESFAFLSRGLDSPAPVFSLIWGGEVALARGEYEKAIELCERGVEMIRPIGLKGFVCEALSIQGRARRAQGRLDEAYALMDEGRELGEAVKARRVLYDLFEELSELQTLRGEARRGRGEQATGTRGRRICRRARSAKSARNISQSAAHSAYHRDATAQPLICFHRWM